MNNMDNLIENKIKSLSIKGFDKKEIARMLDLEEKEVKIEPILDITKNSENLYSELQKDLSKLVLTEMNKDKRDSNVILSSIKLQADLQEKKLVLNRNIKNTKINKDYIYKRDEEIANSRLPIEETAKKFNVSILSVKQALDRYNLGLSDELKTLNPTIISETINLPKKTRLKILQDAYNNNSPRKDVREIVNNIKNETR